MVATARARKRGKTAVKKGTKRRAAKKSAIRKLTKASTKKLAAISKPTSAKKPLAPSNVVETALAAFAHEVRTPLTGILAISSLLATSDLGERERRWVETIKVGAEHLAALATLFVDAARSGNKNLAIRQDFFDLRALSRSVGDSLAGRASAKGLTSVVEISDELPHFTIGDPVRLRAALENLVDNAVKFTEKGEVSLKVTSSGAKVSFAVADRGIGLSLQEIRRLFRPFSQANVTIASRYGGAGLGLSSVKQLARAMGGGISVVQREGGGTTFTLTVALKKTQISSNPQASVDRSSISSRSLSILSVEDNPFGRVVLNAILTELGHRVEFIGRGEDAADRVEKGAFDVVLMDMVLPGIDGVEAIRRVRSLAPPSSRIAIIGLSGRGEDEQASLAAGADAFLTKPVSPRALATALAEATHRAAGEP